MVVYVVKDLERSKERQYIRIGDAINRLGKLRNADLMARRFDTLGQITVFKEDSPIFHLRDGHLTKDPSVIVTEN
jgi:hypothetical protein